VLEESSSSSGDAPPTIDRGWWLAVEYGVVTKQARFEKKLETLRKLGEMKELLEPGGNIVYRNLFREEQVRQAWTLLAEMTPWRGQLRWYLSGEELEFKDVQEILWCAGFLKGERPCKGSVPQGRGKDKTTRAWTVGCDRRISLLPGNFDERSEEKRHLLTFATVNADGMLRFDRDAIGSFASSGVLARRCPLAPARDAQKFASIFQDVSVRALGWPLVLEMGPELEKKLGTASLEAEHGFVLRKGAKGPEQHEPVELRWTGGEVEVRRAHELKGGTIAQKVRVTKRVQQALEEGARLRGVVIEEGYIRMPELGGRYEVEHRFVLATRFHLGMQDDPARYEGYKTGTVPRATPEYEKWAAHVLEQVT